MNNSTPPCSRCRTRKLSCTVNKSIQMLLESDVEYVHYWSCTSCRYVYPDRKYSWKESMERRVDQLERALLSNTCSGSDPIGYAHSGPQITSSADDTSILDQPLTSQGPMHLHRPIQAALNLSCGPGAFPSSSLNTLVVNDQDVPYSTGPDLVTRGIVSQQTLETNFDFYYKCLNPSIYHPLTNVDTVADLLKRSSLLLTAICVTAAFCSGSDDYEACLEIFLRDVSAMTFSHTHSFDDVRALCIGAFWLGKESSALCALGQISPQGLLPSQIHNDLISNSGPHCR